jgi:hypothetical protein
MRSMGKVGRNDPCPCGSGQKFKRCCGAERGPSDEGRAVAFLAEVHADAARVLDVSEARVVEVMEGLCALAEQYPSLQVRLADAGSPAVQRLTQAFLEMDVVGTQEPFEAVLEEADTPVERARLVHAVHALMSDGQLDVAWAAAAAYELSSTSRELFREWLMQGVAVQMAELVAKRMVSGGPGDILDELNPGPG